MARVTSWRRRFAPAIDVAFSNGGRAGLTLFDQGVASLSNFSVGVVVARLAGASGLGGFAFAYAGWQILAAMHRALIIDPMAIEGDARKGKLLEGIERGLAAELLLGAGGVIVMGLLGILLALSGQRTFGVAVMAMAPWLPFLQVQDYWRWMGFLQRRPAHALANDIVFNCAQGAAIFVVILLHSHSVVAVIASWGIGGATGALFGLRQHHVRLSLRGGFELLRNRWSFSKWLAGNQLLGTGQSQLWVVIAGAILGPVGLGGLNAAQALVNGPAGVLIQAGGSIGLPDATKAYAERQWQGLNRVARLITVAGVVSIASVVVVIAVWGKSLLSLLYGPSFGRYHADAFLIGIGFVFIGFCLGPVLVLKATRTTHWLFHAQLVTLVVSLSSIAVLSIEYGIKGAAISTIIYSAVEVVLLAIFQRRTRRTLQSQREPAVLVELPAVQNAAGSGAPSTSAS